MHDRDALLGKYGDYNIPWGPIGEPVFKRTYSHVKPNGRKETWPEAVVRAVMGNVLLAGRAVSPQLSVEDDENLEHLVKLGLIEKDEVEKLCELLLPFASLPAGRHLNASGLIGRQFLFNCHASGWDVEKPWAHFTFLFDALMQGGGVGSNYSNRYMCQLPKLETGIDLHVVCREDHPNLEEFYHLLTAVVPKDQESHGRVFKVPDTREGWVDCPRLIMRHAWMDTRTFSREAKLVIDVSGIRERGAPLKTSGGIACGPGPLVSMLVDFTRHLNGCFDRRLGSLDAMTLDHAQAACVVAGGKRRSSRMAVKKWLDPDIFEFINCKREDGAHWTTNISVETDDDFERAYRDPQNEWHRQAREVMRAVVLGSRSNGEPGFWNRSKAMEGEREPELMFCPNPCGEIGLQMWENCFAGDERLITKEYGAVRFVDVVGMDVTVQTPQGWKPAIISCFGTQNVQRITFAPVRRNTGAEGYQKTRSNYRIDVVVTPNHRWETVDGTVTTALGVGDVVPMNAAPFEKNESYREGVRHGIIFGDGSADRQYADGEWRHRVRLFGAKAEEMAKYFDHLTHPESTNGAPEAWLKTSENLKEFPKNKHSDYPAGFIAGWGMADASDRSNGSLHLGSTNPQADAWLKKNAAAAGWVLRAAKDCGVSETNLGPRKSPLMFFTLCRPDAEGLAWQVVSIEPLPEAVPVYCATVPGVERFTLASGLSTCNCNLGHVNLQYYAQRPLREMEEAYRLVTRWLMRATFGDIPDERQREVVDRNRRIGVGFFGYHGFLALRGIKYSESWNEPVVLFTMKKCRERVQAAASHYAQILGIPVPVKFTTIAPTGTLAALTGCTGGDQAVYAPWFIRRVRYSDMDPELKIKMLEGYTVNTDPDARNTSIVEYWCEDPLVGLVKAAGYDPADVIEAQDEIDLSTNLKVQAMLQEVWADNSISHTINLPADKMPSEQEMEDWLMTFHSKLKGTTIFPDKSRRNPPLERITKEQFDAWPGRKEVTMVEDVCKGGCPVK